ncbi:MAG: hypothetical protein Q4D98_01040 [Planctomycetia bacterium]|nr:hypothetical protein [Planctomycetia bacterium]
MKKYLFAFACVALVVGLTGCKLCCAPYDYCGPVYQCGQCSDLAHRRCGSIAGQQSMVAVSTPQGTLQQVPSKQVPTPAPAPAVGSQVQQVPPSYQRYQQVQYQQFQNRQAQQAPFQQTAQAPAQTGVVQAAALIPTPASSEHAARQNIPAVVPQEGKIAVNADGFQEVAVYDENGRLLGYETIDAEGKTVKALDLSNLR